MGYRTRRFRRGGRYSKRMPRRGGTARKPSGSSFEKKKAAAEKKIVTAEKAVSTAEKNLSAIVVRLDKNMKEGHALNAKLSEAQEKLDQASSKLQEAVSALAAVDSALVQYRQQERHWSPKVVKLTRRHSR